MKTKKGRPKFRNYNTGLTLRMTKLELGKLNVEWTQMRYMKGARDERRVLRSLNEFVMDKLRGKDWRTDYADTRKGI